MAALQLPDIATIREAGKRISGLALRSGLVRLLHPGLADIYLKLENQQPTGSFKIRCASNALLSLRPDEMDKGIVTASAGNFALGLAYAGRELGLAIRVYAPDTAAKSKLEKLTELGAEVRVVSFDDWWHIMETHGSGIDAGHFIHPVAHNDVIAGNATIGLEIVEQMPDVETILVPFGGGGLVTGIASAAKSLLPMVKVFGCESDAARPLHAAFVIGGPIKVNYDKSSFINGIGSTSVLGKMWPLIDKIVDGAISAPVDAVESALQILFHQKEAIVAEGAGAVPVAIALAAGETLGKTVCVVSGGNINKAVLDRILGRGSRR